MVAAIGAASVMVELNGLAKQAGDVRNPDEPNPPTDQARDGARERRPQRQELGAIGHHNPRFLASAENGRLAQVYGVIWDVSTEGRGRTDCVGVNYWGGEIRMDKNLAPQVGLEPTTLRLTAECSTVELLRSKVCHFI